MFATSNSKFIQIPEVHEGVCKTYDAENSLSLQVKVGVSIETPLTDPTECVWIYLEEDKCLEIFKRALDQLQVKGKGPVNLREPLLPGTWDPSKQVYQIKDTDCAIPLTKPQCEALKWLKQSCQILYIDILHRPSQFDYDESEKANEALDEQKDLQRLRQQVQEKDEQIQTLMQQLQAKDAQIKALQALVEQ